MEEKEPSELVEAARLLPEVSIKNLSFDITPLKLVTAIVTENGLLYHQEVMRHLERYPD